MLKRLQGINWFILLPAILISLFGIFTQASNSINDVGEIVWDGILSRHIMFIIIGIIVYFLVERVDLSYFRTSHLNVTAYVIIFALLLMTLFFGTLVKGAKRWIDIAGIQFQPAELAKILVVFISSYIFTQRHKYADWGRLAIMFGSILPILFLIYLQPHGSMALILLVIAFAVSFIGMKDKVQVLTIITVLSLILVGLWWTFSTGNLTALFLVFLGLIIAVFGFFFSMEWRLPMIIAVVGAVFIGMIGPALYNNVLQDYQRERILVFIGAVEDEKGSQFNTEQAKIAIGSGGVWGKGFGQGSQSRLDFLPEAETDFIFASFAEIAGNVWTVGLLILYLIMLVSIFLVPVVLKLDRFMALIVIGLGIKIMLEITINIGTNTQLLPATGIPLPFFSAGGTFMITTFFSLGLIQSIISRASEQSFAHVSLTEMEA